MDFLGPGGGYKTVCRVMGPEMKKKYILLETPFLILLPTYLAFHVRLCVWSTFWPSSNQAITNLSTDLDFLSQVRGNKTICNMKRWEIKILLSSLFSFCMSRWRMYFRISSLFVCLINLFTPFPSRYFKSKHRFRLLGSRLR